MLAAPRAKRASAGVELTVRISPRVVSGVSASTIGPPAVQILATVHSYNPTAFSPDMAVRKNSSPTPQVAGRVMPVRAGRGEISRPPVGCAQTEAHKAKISKNLFIPIRL